MKRKVSTSISCAGQLFYFLRCFLVCVCLFVVFGLITFQKRQREPLRQLQIRGESTRRKLKLSGNASVARLFIGWKKMSVRAEIEKNKQTNKNKNRAKRPVWTGKKNFVIRNILLEKRGPDCFFILVWNVTSKSVPLWRLIINL